MKFCTLRMFFAMVTDYYILFHQRYIKTSSLHGFHEQGIFLEQPEGFGERDRPNHVCKLMKALYDLKKSPSWRLLETIK